MGAKGGELDGLGVVGGVKSPTNDWANAGEREAEELEEEIEAALAQDHYTPYFACCV
jgi:hypothetical protein